MVILRAAVEAGAPEGIIDCLEDPTPQLSQQLMSHKDINLILATGGPGMVHAAYSSGTPAIGVGAGNTPVVIDATADIKMAVNSILLSKTFDNGMICASEQTVIAEDAVADQVKEFIRRGAWFANEEEAEKLAHVIFVNGALNSAIVGQPAAKIAAMAGIELPASTKVLLAERKAIRADDPFAHEKLSLCLAFTARQILIPPLAWPSSLWSLGGRPHSRALHKRSQPGTDPQI